MKKNKKITMIISIIVIMITFIGITNFVDATNKDVILEQVKSNICNINSEEDGLIFTKKITSINDEKKEVTMQMSIENLGFEENSSEAAEIFFVIDNSGSMLSTVSTGKSRQDVLNGAAKTLAKEILEENPNTKIGVVQFYKAYFQLDDAKIEIMPTNILSDIENAIDNIKATDGGTNIDAGLQVAKNNFTTDSNKTIILLTDGAPIACVGYVEEQSKIIKKTKDTLESIIDSQINLITVLTEVNDSYIYIDGLTEKQIVDQVFGTQTNPNYGKFYYTSDDNIEETILNNVYNDITDILSNELQNIAIVDYFPEEILENYYIEITKEPDIGTATLLTNNITWNIEILQLGEKSYLEYKLKLKEDYNKNIINVETLTNKKVDLTYTNKDMKSKIETSSISPSIILKEQKTIDNTVTNEIVNETTNETTNEILNEAINETINETVNTNKIISDNTTSSKILPNTGENSNIFKILIFGMIFITIFIYIIYTKYYKEI